MFKACAATGAGCIIGCGQQVLSALQSAANNKHMHMKQYYNNTPQYILSEIKGYLHCRSVCHVVRCFIFEHPTRSCSILGLHILEVLCNISAVQLPLCASTVQILPKNVNLSIGVLTYSCTLVFFRLRYKGNQPSTSAAVLLALLLQQWTYQRVCQRSRLTLTCRRP